MSAHDVLRAIFGARHAPHAAPASGDAGDAVTAADNAPLSLGIAVTTAAAPPSPGPPRPVTGAGRPGDAGMSADQRLEGGCHRVTTSPAGKQFLSLLPPEAIGEFEERAAILEYDHGLSRGDAERIAAGDVLAAGRERVEPT